MKTYVVDFFEKFVCMGAECPYTCCKGWNIVLDEETRVNFLKEPGLRGLALNSFGTKVKSQLKCTRRNYFGRCVFHTGDRLCYFQKTGRWDLMPEVCKKYPRVPVDYGEYVECCLELSCYKAVLLLLGKDAKTIFLQANTEMTAKWQIGNKDADFLAFVNTTRGQIVDYVYTKGNILSKITEIYRCIYVINTQLAVDGVAKASEFHVPLTAEGQENYDIPQVSGSKVRGMYEISFLDKAINEILVKSESARKTELMHKVISRYNHIFEKMTFAQANEYFSRKYDELLSDNLEMQHYFNLYYSYIILQNYSLAYEDYYVLGPVLLANFNITLIILFCISEIISGIDLSKEHLAAIIANVEKMTRHNMDFEKSMLDRIRRLFT